MSIPNEAPIESPAVEAPPTEGAKPSVVDVAAYDFMNLLPEFRKKIEECSNRQLKKVVTALIEHPFEPVEFHWSYPQEEQLFTLGSKIMDCRFVMMKAVFEMKKDEIEKLRTEVSETKKEQHVGNES